MAQRRSRRKEDGENQCYDVLCCVMLCTNAGVGDEWSVGDEQDADEEDHIEGRNRGNSASVDWTDGGYSDHKTVMDMYLGISRLRRIRDEGHGTRNHVTTESVRSLISETDNDSRSAKYDHVARPEFDRIHKKLLLEHAKAYSVHNHRAIINSWSAGNSKGNHAQLISFYNRSPENLALADIPRLCAEYKLLVEACASLSYDIGLQK